MFSLIEAFRSALASVKAHRFRSFLTTLGIVIGVSSTIAVVSIIQGLSYTVNKQFEGFGANTISVRSFLPREERLKGKTAWLTTKDVRMIKERVSGIKIITPQLFSQSRLSAVEYHGSQSFSQMVGTTYSYQDMNQLEVASGRFLNFNDNQSRRKVMVIGPKVRENLDLPKDPTGKFVKFGGEWFKIVGMTESKGSLLGFDQDDFAIIPFSTMDTINGNQLNQNIFLQLQLKDMNKLEPIKHQISQILRKNHGLKPGEDDDFKIETPEQLTSGFNQVISVMTVVLGGIVSISLVVGGIGIMNIMLVSVTERTREIGICKAIGAKRHHILMQFLIEAIVLSLIGGIIGILLGYGLGMLASALNPNIPEANVPLWAIGIAFGFSAFVGVLFGILPAAKAANLDPIDALRYE